MFASSLVEPGEVRVLELRAFVQYYELLLLLSFYSFCQLHYSDDFDPEVPPRASRGGRNSGRTALMPVILQKSTSADIAPRRSPDTRIHCPMLKQNVDVAMRVTKREPEWDTAFVERSSI